MLMQDQMNLIMKSYILFGVKQMLKALLKLNNFSKTHLKRNMCRPACCCWYGEAGPHQQVREGFRKPGHGKKLTTIPPQIFNRKWTESCQKVNEKGGGGTPCLNGIFLWLGFLNSFPSLVVIVVRSFGNTGKKSNPPSWQQQLVRVARAGKAWGPLIRCNLTSLDKNIVMGILISISLSKLRTFNPKPLVRSQSPI